MKIIKTETQPIFKMYLDFIKKSHSLIVFLSRQSAHGTLVTKIGICRLICSIIALEIHNSKAVFYVKFVHRCLESFIQHTL